MISANFFSAAFFSSSPPVTLSCGRQVPPAPRQPLATPSAWHTVTQRTQPLLGSAGRPRCLLGAQGGDPNLCSAAGHPPGDTAARVCGSCALSVRRWRAVRPAGSRSSPSCAATRRARCRPSGHLRPPPKRRAIGSVDHASAHPWTSAAWMLQLSTTSSRCTTRRAIAKIFLWAPLAPPAAAAALLLAASVHFADLNAVQMWRTASNRPGPDAGPGPATGSHRGQETSSLSGLAAAGEQLDAPPSWWSACRAASATPGQAQGWWPRPPPT